MTEEIPKKLIFVILIVAIALSLLGTWITLENLNSKNEVYYLQPTGGAKVGFTIVENPADSEGANTNG